MGGRGRRGALGAALVLGVLACVGAGGCETFSNRLSKWHMLGAEAPEDPIQAVGGDGVVFAPADEGSPRGRARLAAASPQELVEYYAPVFVQQRVNTAAQRHPYPPSYDEIGEARMRRDKGVDLKAFVAGPPKVYAICEERHLGGHDHVQLTYTAWYPAHPRLKMIDLEEADIDSCVVRVTLDAEHAPLFYETIAACGCFHKVFVERWLEEAAASSYGPPEKGKKYAVERTVKSSIDWEVAGVVDEPRDRPRRPVVFIKAGDHKVLGLGSTARLRVPQGADVRPYELADYAELYSLPVEGGGERAPFFDLGQGGKVYGAERKERFLFSLIGVDDAGHPRANDQIKMHFDQSTWGDATIYERFLRLPAGAL
jgi:hypothetical protein